MFRSLHRWFAFSEKARWLGRTRSEAPREPVLNAQSIASRLARRLRKERLDDFFQVGALAFRAVHVLRFVLLDGQLFAKFVVTLAADVLVKGHRLVRLGLRVWFRSLKRSLQTIFLKAVPRSPPLAKDAPLFALRDRGHQSFAIRQGKVIVRLEHCLQPLSYIHLWLQLSFVHESAYTRVGKQDASFAQIRMSGCFHLMILKTRF